MRRADFVRLTRLSPAFFNALGRRGYFPFLRPADGPRGWGDYRAGDALKTVLALALAEAGATQEAAGHFVQAEFDRLKQHGLALAAPLSDDVYLGYARLNRVEPDPASGEDATFSVVWPVSGRLAEVLASVISLQHDWPSSGLASLVIVNASEQLRQLTARANELELKDLSLDRRSLFEHERGQ